MKFILQDTGNLSEDIVQQVKEHVPRNGLQKDLLNNITNDLRVQFANNQKSALLLEQNELQSFCSIGQDELFNKSISESLLLIPEETLTLIYLFTPSKLQRKGNAHILIKEIATHIKNKENNSIKQIVRTTSSKENKNLYLKYGAQLIQPKSSHPYFKDLGIEKDYFFIYSI